MEIDYNALTVEEMESLAKNLNEQAEKRRTSLVDGILREMYPYVADNSKLVQEINKLPSNLKNKRILEMLSESEHQQLFDEISGYTEDLSLGDIIMLLRLAIESYHNYM